MQRFPHLIQVPTIENFLPFHAVCSQGHVEILKLLLGYDPAFNENSELSTTIQAYFDESDFDYKRVFADHTGGNKYLNSFDLNELDMNGHNGLHAAVLANHENIVYQLLNYRVKKLTLSDLNEYEKKIKHKLHMKALRLQQTQRRNSTPQRSKSIDEIGSLIDHFKNVFLDIKSYDPYVVNYHNEEEQLETINQNLEPADVNLNRTISPRISECEEEWFNPFNVDSYSKFGSTCVHEAIRNGNRNIVSLLIESGHANVNLPVCDANGAVLSNCLCEAIKKRDEAVFLLVLDQFIYDELNFNIAYRLCINMWQNELKEMSRESLMKAGSFFNSKKMLAYLMRCKNLQDPEFKISLKNRLTSTRLNSMGVSAENGLILNWNNLEPKLNVLYELWLLESSKHFKRGLKTSASYSSSVNKEHALSKLEPLSMGNIRMSTGEPSKLKKQLQSRRLNINPKKLHLYVITRIDLSQNNLELLPFSLFQIESLKYLKLSGNRLKQLPTSPNLLDDVNKAIYLEKLGDESSRLIWNCNNLEELDLDKNQLSELVVELFKIKGLKHLNVSNNNLQGLPVEFWTAPALLEFNAAFNKLERLPLVSAKSTKEDHTRRLGRAAPRSRRDEAGERSIIKQHPLEERKTPEHDLRSSACHVPVSYEEKDVQKANFWQVYSTAASAQLFEKGLDDEDTEQKEKILKSKFSQLADRQPSHGMRLTELNLSHNKFSKMPECLSCLTPRLAKLNLSFNNLESMGAVCDLPNSLKFLDLSNNMIRFPMRLLNEQLLNLVSSYLDKFCVSFPKESDYKELLASYNSLGCLLIENQFCYSSLVGNAVGPGSDTRFRQRSPRQSVNPFSPIKPQTPANLRSLSTNRRRTRSQSRNHRITNAPLSLIGQNHVAFDIFLMNVGFVNSNSGRCGYLGDLTDPDMSSIHNPHELERREKRLLNALNIQTFMEHMCPHKRHVKLDHLKSLNLSQNRLKRCRLMLALSESNEQLPMKVKNDSLTSESDLTCSDASLSDFEEGEKAKVKPENKYAVKLKATLHIDKKLNKTDANKHVNKKEERSKMIAQLMYPNLTHLDLSFNLLRCLSGHIMFIENLSYFNASSNIYLTRVSPRIGLLNKLWNFDLKNCVNLKYPANLEGLIRQQTKTVDLLGYLKSILEHSKPYARVKLMFVGVQAIGKTSLLSRLREEGVHTSHSHRQSWSERSSQANSSPTSSSFSSSLPSGAAAAASLANANISTVGIDINEWVYEKSKHKVGVQSLQQLQLQSVYLYQMDQVASSKITGPITFRTWDFGGQREYYSTHQVSDSIELHLKN